MGIFLFLLFIGLVINSMSNPTRVPNKECKGHTWVYKNLGTDHEYMVCTKCKMLPGTGFKEEDSPY